MTYKFADAHGWEWQASRLGIGEPQNGTRNLDGALRPIVRKSMLMGEAIVLNGDKIKLALHPYRDDEWCAKGNAASIWDAVRWHAGVAR
jgi:hypothetical protein